MPNIMWLTPKMTEIFILNELRKEILLVANCQAWQTATHAHSATTTTALHSSADSLNLQLL